MKYSGCTHRLNVRNGPQSSSPSTVTDLFLCIRGIYCGDTKGYVLIPTLSVYEWTGQSGNKCQVGKKYSKCHKRVAWEGLMTLTPDLILEGLNSERGSGMDKSTLVGMCPKAKGSEQADCSKSIP